MDDILIGSGWKPPTLTTERLALRALVEEDAEALYRIACNPNVTPYVTWDAHTSIDVTRGFINGYVREKYMEALPDPMAVTPKENPAEILGAVGLRWGSREHFRLDLGYWIAEPHWGKGYATEAAARLLVFAFNNYTVERIEAHCVVENAASARVLEKIGMKLEGVLRCLVFLRGRFWDIKQYSILRKEWEGV